MTKISKHLPSGTLQSRCLRGGAIFWWGGTCKFHSSSFPFRHTENKGAWFTFCKTIRFWILFLQTFEVHRCQNRVYPSLTVRRETARHWNTLSCLKTPWSLVLICIFYFEEAPCVLWLGRFSLLVILTGEYYICFRLLADLCK